MPRKRKCKAPDCETRYEPISQFQKACSVKCALIVNKADSKRRRRAEIRQARQRLKPRSKWLSEAQDAFNAYIRERDKGLPCISCGEYLGEGPNLYDCGHFRGVGACPQLRFCEDNAARQCKSCNGGHFRKKHFVVSAERKETIRSQYRENLVKKIGLERVEWIEGPHEPKRYRIDDLKALRDEYKKKLKDLRGRSY